MRFLLFLFAFALHANQAYFIPPEKWEIAQLKNPSPHVKIGFLGKGSTDFRPSINLATEEVDVPLKEYVKAVKELQQADPKSKWRDLGKLKMRGGTGRLTEMSGNTPWGEIKILQAFLVVDQTAYILTASALKEDLPKCQADLLKAFESLDVIPDVWAPLKDPGEREKLQKEQDRKRLQALIHEHSELGAYWQFLALQHVEKQAPSTLKPE